MLIEASGLDQSPIFSRFASPWQTLTHMAISGQRHSILAFIQIPWQALARNKKWQRSGPLQENHPIAPAGWNLWAFSEDWQSFCW